MPEYRFQAQDTHGQPHSGVLNADTADAAIRDLGQRGLRVKSIQVNRGGAPVSPVAPKPAPIAQQPAPVINSGVGTVPPSVVMNQPQSQASTPGPRAMAHEMGKLGFLRDSDLGMLFARIANQLKAGINPASTFAEMARTGAVREQFRATFEDVAKRTAEGGSLADAMAAHPQVFPAAAVGAIRAGEAGGYVPEAAEVYSEAMLSASRLRKTMFFFNFSVANIIITIPFIFVALKGMGAMLEWINDPQGTTGQAFWRGIKEGMIGPFGFLTIALILGSIFAPRILGQPKFTQFRHFWGAKAGGARKRATYESSNLLSFHLAKLGQAGLSPQRSWSLAADAVTNRVHAEEFLRAGAHARPETPLSDILIRCHGFPQEHVPIVKTGEQTGTVPNALNQAIEVSRRSMNSAENFFKFRVKIWAGILVLCVGFLLIHMFYRGFYDQMFDIILRDT
ncbi:MAG: type II secretion system F family protein [Armatimonadetes bacterium]|nr:type II secretion system F family protein [Armatimonadota bacterium]